MGRKKMKTVEKVDIRLRMDTDAAARIQKAADRLGNTVAGFIRAAALREAGRIEREEEGK